MSSGCQVSRRFAAGFGLPSRTETVDFADWRGCSTRPVDRWKREVSSQPDTDPATNRIGDQNVQRQAWAHFMLLETTVRQIGTLKNPPSNSISTARRLRTSAMAMKKTSLQTFGLFLGLAAIVASAPLLWALRMSQPKVDPGLAVGMPLPALSAEGTINGPLPTVNELRGKVVVVNAWATRCPYCIEGMPKLVDLHKKYGKDGVIFVGVTTEEKDMLEDINGVVEKFDIEYPIAYGALDTSVALEARRIPGYWVFDKNGKVVWNKASTGEMSEAIEKALSAEG